MKRCTYVGCLRACAATTSGGAEYALCDRHLRQYLAEAYWHAAEVLLDMVDDRIRDMAADTAEPDGFGLPDIALADPGDHFAGMPA